MRLSRDICLGGHWNNRYVLGIKYVDHDRNGHIIYLKTDGVYNAYTVTGGGFEIINDDNLYSMHLSPYLEPGDGRIIKEERDSCSYSENGTYKAIMSGRIKAPNSSVLEIKSIRRDTIDLSYFCGGFGASDTPYGFTNLKSFEFEAEDFPTNPTTTYRMFQGCESLEKVVIGCENDSLIDTIEMFHGCSKLVDVNLRNFKTANIKSMAFMFLNCSSLETLDLSSWNTGNVVHIAGMFEGCTNLKNLNLSNWNTANVTDMTGVFEDCQSLATLDVSHFNTENTKNFNAMFNGCSSLISLDVTNFNTSKATDIGWMFGGCSSLLSLDLSQFNTSKVENMSGVFNGCSSLREIKGLANFNASKVLHTKWMFEGCIGLTSLDLSHFNTTVWSAEGMFKGCYNLKQLDISNLIIIAPAHDSGVQAMFSGCSSLETLDLSKLTIPNATSIAEMFKDCSSLKILNLSNLQCEPYYVDDLFTGCNALQELRLDNCPYDTIRILISKLPKHTKPDDITHCIYCKQSNTRSSDGTYLTPPTGWKFEYVQE